MVIPVCQTELGERGEPLKLITEGRVVGPDEMDNSQKIGDFLCDMFRAHKMTEEHIFLICVDPGLRPIGIFLAAHGTVNTCHFAVGDIFKKVLCCNASGFIMAHNHPSGNPSPSKDDIKITQDIVNAGKLMGIPLVDHVIVGDRLYYSLSENGYC